MTATALAAVIVVSLGLGLQLLTRHWEGELRARTTPVSESRPRCRKAWLAVLSLALAVAPYVTLLGISRVVFSLLPVGAIPSGIVALVIFTVLLYRFLYAIARVLLDSDTPNDRLLPIDDNAAQQSWRWVSRLITLLVTTACVVCIVDLSTFIGQKLVEPSPAGAEPSKTRKTLVPLMATMLKYGALCAGGLIVLHQVGVNITPILTGVGILSLAVGFGAQTLVKDMIHGLFILVEDSIAVGDVVSIRGTGGLVEAVNLRTIRLRDLQASVHGSVPDLLIFLTLPGI